MTLGTGTPFDYGKLKPGKRTIKVTVSDGVDSIEDEFTITITKEEQSPTFGWTLTLLAMVVVIAVLLMRGKDG